MDIIRKKILQTFAKKIISEFEKNLRKPIHYIDINIQSNRNMNSACFDKKNKCIGVSTNVATEQEINVLAGFFAEEKVKLDKGFFNINFLFSRTAAQIDCFLTDSNKPDIHTLIKF